MPSEKELSELIRDRIEAMPEDLRADERTVASRLECCRACDHLMSGTCALCGCYVELRAAKKAQCCPDVPGKW